MYGTSNSTVSSTPSYTVVVTVVSTGNLAGAICTASQDTTSLVAITNTEGMAVFRLPSSGVWSFTCNKATPQTPVIVTVSGSNTRVSFNISPFDTHVLNFNASAYPTDPTGCFSYGGDCEGFTPVSNPNTTEFGSANVGSWGFNSYGYGPFGMFYATLNADRTVSSILDPYDLTKNIDGSASDIETLNTMLVIPTLYIKRSSAGITISTDPSKGTPYAHTIDGEVYDHLGIGVYYSSYIPLPNGGTTMISSLSGKSPVPFGFGYNINNLREQVHYIGDGWMLWNYHMWMLMRDLSVLFPAKSFDSQGKIGRGGTDFETYITGSLNKAGPWAGSTEGDGEHVKALIEDPWGCQSEWIDDLFQSDYIFYAGQNSNPTIADTANKVPTGIELKTYGYDNFSYGQTITYGDTSFGIGTSLGGDSNTGLCDRQCGGPGRYNVLVGGSSESARLGNAGISYFFVNAGQERESASRIACVFN